MRVRRHGASPLFFYYYAIARIRPTRGTELAVEYILRLANPPTPF